VVGNGQNFGIFAGFVAHFQDADWAAADDRARLDRLWKQHQHVSSIAVTTQSVRNVAIVAGVIHGGTDEAIDKQGLAVFIDFVFDGAVHGDFDHHVNIIRQVLTRWNKIKAHRWLPVNKGEVDIKSGGGFYPRGFSAQMPAAGEAARNVGHRRGRGELRRDKWSQ